MRSVEFTSTVNCHRVGGRSRHIASRQTRGQQALFSALPFGFDDSAVNKRSSRLAPFCKSNYWESAGRSVGRSAEWRGGGSRYWMRYVGQPGAPGSEPAPDVLVDCWPATRLGLGAWSSSTSEMERQRRPAACGDCAVTMEGFYPRDARRADLGIATLSCPSVLLSVTLVYRSHITHISWIIRKAVTGVIILGSSINGVQHLQPSRRGTLPNFG